MILFIVPNEAMLTKTKSLVRKLLLELELEVSHPSIQITTNDKLMQHGFTADIWTELA